jgi:hypothetical protein
VLIELNDCVNVKELYFAEKGMQMLKYFLAILIITG